MVARKRYDPQAQGLGAEHLVAGFSRLDPEVFMRNRHAGLYSVKLSMEKVPQFDKGPFKRARKQKQKKKVHSFKKFGADGFVPEIPRVQSYKPKGKQMSHSSLKSRKCLERKAVRNFKASEELMLSKKVRRVLNQTESLATSLEGKKFSQEEYHLRLKVLNEMIWTSEELAKKASKARAILISNQVFKEKENVRKEFC